MKEDHALLPDLCLVLILKSSHTSLTHRKVQSQAPGLRPVNQTAVMTKSSIRIKITLSSVKGHFLFLLSDLVITAVWFTGRSPGACDWSFR